MITAREKGRHLEVIVGGGEDALTYLIPPISTAHGSQLLASWVDLAFGLAASDEDALKTARDVAVLALGEDAYTRVAELRWAEQEQVVNAAFFWNVQGGGIDLTARYLAEGFPKAREALLQAVPGLWDAASLLQTSPASA